MQLTAEFMTRRREIPVASELLPFAGRTWGGGAINRYSCASLWGIFWKKIYGNCVRDGITARRSVRETRPDVLPEKRRFLSEFNYCVGVFPDRRQGPPYETTGRSANKLSNNIAACVVARGWPWYARRKSGFPPEHVHPCQLNFFVFRIDSETTGRIVFQTKRRVTRFTVIGQRHEESPSDGRTIRALR